MPATAPVSRLRVAGAELSVAPPLAVTVIRGAGHTPHHTHPDAFAAIIRA